MLMEISHKDVAPGVAVVALAGRVMMGPQSEQIVTLVEELLRQGKKTVIFDLSGVTSIDSTGIGRFISSFNKIAAAGGEMRMAGATGHLFDAFHVSLLDTVFPFYGSVEEASQA
ncbi:MAG: STAS domain-containing protein [Acidobacteriia bacterium]|nr:STAS domain-containing protein [Terriglobia bacterium]